MPDASFAVARLAEVYDPLDPDRRSDLEDCEVWDSAGSLVAQARQLARLPRG